MSDIRLDKQHFSVLEYIYDNPYISYASLKSVFSSCNDIEDIVLLLDQYRMVSLRIASSHDTDNAKYECRFLEDNSHLVAITAGNAIIEEERKHLTELEKYIQPLQAQAEYLKTQAESAKIQAELAVEASRIAKADAKKAQRDALFSKIMAILALIVAILNPFLSEYASLITEWLLTLF